MNEKRMGIGFVVIGLATFWICTFGAVLYVIAHFVSKNW